MDFHKWNERAPWKWWHQLIITTGKKRQFKIKQTNTLQKYYHNLLYKYQSTFERAHLHKNNCVLNFKSCEQWINDKFIRNSSFIRTKHTLEEQPRNVWRTLTWSRPSCTEWTTYITHQFTCRDNCNLHNVPAGLHHHQRIRAFQQE